jgi:hypothetical protein
MTYRYCWGPRIKNSRLKQLDRKGERCRVIVRGAMNSALIEFEDGEQAVVSRNALRKLNHEPVLALPSSVVDSQQLSCVRANEAI